MFSTQERKLPVNTLQQLQVRSSFDDFNSLWAVRAQDISLIVSLTEHAHLGGLLRLLAGSRWERVGDDRDHVA